MALKCLEHWVNFVLEYEDGYLGTRNDRNGKTTSFSLFWSVFMGYYYHIFRRHVYASSLALQTVEGA